MASFPMLFFSHLFLLFLLSVNVHGGEAPLFHSISRRSLIPSTECSTASNNSSNNQLAVVHRHGPCSPLGHRRPPPHRRTLRRDAIRAASLQSKLSSSRSPSTGSTSSVTIPSRPGLAFDSMEYVVKVGFGTPTRYLSVIFDTGSDVSWIQCEPCVGSCYPQLDPIFDPTKSSTYSNVSCSDPDCPLASTSSPFCDSSNCLYSVQYADDSYTAGFFASETLSITPSDTLTGFKFGCGQDSSNLFGEVAGLLGLGRSKVSLSSQAAEKYGGAFSYCLPPLASSTGFLTFGVPGSPPSVQFTPMLSNPLAPSLYFLDLVGLSVGGKDLQIPRTVFSDVGTILDSGTVITRLPPAAYGPLRDEFRRQMAGYPTAPPFLILDTCYDFTGKKTVSVPGVGLRFGGEVAVDVDASGILYVVSASQACFAFAENSDPSDVSIIGNMQQRTYTVVFDVGKGMIGFGPGGCS